MNNADLILNIQNKYDKRTREEILTNLNIAILLGKMKGLKVDRYVALPKVTQRSKHTVMSWFNRPTKKIPLIDLCMIAKYLNYNIFTFFNVKEFGIMTKQEFLINNDYNNSHYAVNSADIYIRAYNLQYETDKDIVINNIEKYYGTSEEILEHHSNSRQTTIMDICKCNSKQSYYSWFNRSRKNVKIPLIPLCKLSSNADIDLFWIFEEHETNDIIDK